MYILIEENPNCDEVPGRVFNDQGEPKPVGEVLRLRQGKEIWCEIAAVDAGLKPRPAMGRKVDDSGDGSCYLVYGGAWGLRLKESGSSGEWSLESPDQWGEPFLLLSADGKDIRFK
jgi:hypothetical protein